MSDAIKFGMLILLIAGGLIFLGASAATNAGQKLTVYVQMVYPGYSIVSKRYTDNAQDKSLVDVKVRIRNKEGKIKELDLSCGRIYTASTCWER